MGISWSWVMPQHWMMDCAMDWFLSLAFQVKKKKNLTEPWGEKKLWSQSLLLYVFCSDYGFFFLVQHLPTYFNDKKGSADGEGVASMCYAAVHFQCIIEVIILKWLQLVKCQAHFAFSWWLADKVPQRYVKRLIAVGFHEVMCLKETGGINTPLFKL